MYISMAYSKVLVIVILRAFIFLDYWFFFKQKRKQNHHNIHQSSLVTKQNKGVWDLHILKVHFIKMSLK